MEEKTLLKEPLRVERSLSGPGWSRKPVPGVLRSWGARDQASLTEDGEGMA